jgi:putative CocE/NonD family hydrolase
MSPGSRRVARVVGVVVGVLVLAVVALSLLQPARPAAAVTSPRVAMPDGVRLAVDVILPSPMPAARVPVVLVQTRYWRSLRLVFPDQPGVPPVGPRDGTVDALVAAGYGVVIADARGTGASEGTWPRPWSDAEVADGRALVDWIASQPFCDGRIGTLGLSYEGTTAMLAATSTNPALKVAVVREIEWDLVDELLAPGGVRNLTFVEAWGRAVADLDSGRAPEFFPASLRAVIRGVRPFDGDDDGVALAALRKGRRIADVARAVAGVRAGSDDFAGVPAARVGPSAHAEALSRTGAKVVLWGGWWDGATADAVFRADDTIGLTEAVVGPWTHEGDASASPFEGGRDATVKIADLVAVFDRHLRGTSAPAPKKRFWVAGTEQWRTSERWPETSMRAFSLIDGGRLATTPGPLSLDFEVDFAATTGTTNRWMTGLLHPVDTGDRAKVAGLVRFDLAPEPMRVFGPAHLRCAVRTDGEAALFAYLEVVLPDGTARLVTEGVSRVTGPDVDVRLRPIALELPAGAHLRLALSGADGPTFERVPASGPRRLSLRESCSLELPMAAAF